MMNEAMNDKQMSADQLDNVTGGTYVDSMNVAMFLQKAGHKNLMDKSGLKVNFNAMRDAIKELGFTSKDHGGLLHENSYKQDSTGKTFSQQEFMDFLHKKYPKVK